MPQARSAAQARPNTRKAMPRSDRRSDLLLITTSSDLIGGAALDLYARSRALERVGQSAALDACASRFVVVQRSARCDDHHLPSLAISEESASGSPCSTQSC